MKARSENTRWKSEEMKSENIEYENISTYQDINRSRYNKITR
jgi:hypothetical protein